MSSEYRDELAAAHARIAEFEEKVRALEEEAHPATAPLDGRFPELEAAVARLRVAADPVRNAELRTRVSIVGALFPLAGMVFTFLHLPIVATVCSVAFIALVIANVAIASRLKTSTQRLNEAEAKLGDARRIAQLESKLASAKIRIAAEPEPDAEPDAEENDARISPRASL